VRWDAAGDVINIEEAPPHSWRVAAFVLQRERRLSGDEIDTSGSRIGSWAVDQFGDIEDRFIARR
jgi:hypothetical protein